jgi:hypothetical protein
MALFSGVTVAAVGLLDWSSSSLGSSSKNTPSTGKSLQSGQSQTNSSNHPTINYFSQNYLTFVAGLTLDGEEFCGCIMNWNRLYNILL